MLASKIFFGCSLFLAACLYFKTPASPHLYSVATVAAQDQVAAQNQSAGKEIYTDFCIQCHGANGKGDTKNFPPLDGSDWLINKRAQSIHAVKFGQSKEIVVNKKKFNNTMPAMGLTNKEVADVMNYIMNSWSNKQSKLVTEKEVAAIKE